MIRCARHVCPGCGGAKDFYATTCIRCRQRPLTERILDAIEPEPNSGCWLWIGSARLDNSGQLRGRISIGNRATIAYRAAYEAFVGPIPDGLEIDHKCRLPLCVNPRHLEPVTSQENQRRGKGSYPTCKRGHPFDERNTAIRFNKKLGKKQRACRRCEVLHMQASRRRRTGQS